MSVFRFKHFSIQQQNSALKVGTDAMLLGSLCNWDSPTRLLDIGTGTGVLTLMCAQRFPFREIIGLEIDPEAANEAKQNIFDSPFASPIEIARERIQDYQPEQLFDAIISNPPFFENSSKNENKQSELARHTDTLSYSDLVSAINRLLSPEGKAWIILPNSAEDSIQRLTAQNGLSISHMIYLEGKPGKHVRTIFAIGKVQSETVLSKFTIRNEDGSYSEEYKVLTKEFHDREL